MQDIARCVTAKHVVQMSCMLAVAMVVAGFCGAMRYRPRDRTVLSGSRHRFQIRSAWVGRALPP
ncbi:hypothetical protein NG824_10735 [Xanthomonas sacchari]|uniref:Uncharacterized protein n=1 Tax=Xanthomonas sacchari TaxID=56458 RepID=A0AA46PQ39_9XANT|nr:hypothetical protein [Xanthomonas sacchari]UYK87012.1 hypothetical protein NG824_10735 [Xanthomonas sacchari]